MSFLTVLHQCGMRQLFNHFSMEQCPSGQGAGFSIQESCVKIQWVSPRSIQSFILSRLIKWQYKINCLIVVALWPLRYLNPSQKISHVCVELPLVMFASSLIIYGRRLVINFYTSAQQSYLSESGVVTSCKNLHQKKVIGKREIKRSRIKNNTE